MNKEKECDKTKEAILSRLHKAVGICTLCGKIDCPELNTKLPEVISTEDVLKAIDYQ